MENLVRSVVHELAHRFPSRNAYDPKALGGAAEYLESELRLRDLEVESDWFFDGMSKVRNLIVQIPGLEPEAPRLIIGAHYDTVLGTPGADDNATGVAAVIELAVRFRSIPMRHPLCFVLFAHEEPPYFSTSAMGSRQYASGLHRSGTPVLFMMSLEMLGYASSDLIQLYPFPLMRTLGGYPREADFIAVVGNLRSIKGLRILVRGMRRACAVRVESLSAPGFLSPLYLSDHSSFWRYGFPAVMITDTAFLRNPHYHQATDTPETLNWKFLGEVINGIEGGIRTLDAKR